MQHDEHVGYLRVEQALDPLKTAQSWRGHKTLSVLLDTYLGVMHGDTQVGLARWEQALLDAFADVYNTTRPHRALGRATPSEAWHARPHAAPTGDLAAPHYRVRRDVVNSGRVTLRHNSRLHHIGLGTAHNGSHILILVADLHVRVITTDGELLRDFQLDPTRDYQPRGEKPGPKPH